MNIYNSFLLVVRLSTVSRRCKVRTLFLNIRWSVFKRWWFYLIMVEADFRLLLGNRLSYILIIIRCTNIAISKLLQILLDISVNGYFWGTMSMKRMPRSWFRLKFPTTLSTLLPLLANFWRDLTEISLKLLFCNIVDLFRVHSLINSILISLIFHLFKKCYFRPRSNFLK